ncbi:MAG: IS1634 family transposase [Candidatus Dormibacteraceae bacterium]
MYLDRSQTTVNRKTYQRVLLRQSFRQEGKVKHRTIANLSACSPAELQAIALALKHKHDLDSLRPSAPGPLHLRQGLSFGAVWALHQLAERIGLTEVLGSERQGKLALWQVLARAIQPGSRLSAVRLAGSHAACDVLELGPFNEDQLYPNLAWLAENQARIEQELFKKLHPNGCPDLFLYDVTSSYLEGDQNALAAWGYNRDGKPGKKQIVIGLLCDGQGRALSIEVFVGNTGDPKTVGSQIQKVVERFGGKGVTFVGDRGMIKGPQIKELGQEQFHYITAISKPQIQSLLQKKVFPMELFDTTVSEVASIPEKVRYILRRNPQRALETQQSRQSKQNSLAKLLEEKNNYLAQKPKAQVEVALKAVWARAAQWKINDWLSLQAQGRKLVWTLDEPALAEAQKLDGCYVIKTDLLGDWATTQVVHDRYKDLALVEQNFRTSKTVELEMRPVHVRLESSTRGHVLVVMLAHRLIQELQPCWATENLTVQEAIDELSSLCVTEVVVNDTVKDQLVPEGRAQVKRLLELAKVQMPKKLHYTGSTVATRKQLKESRPKRCK